MHQTDGLLTDLCASLHRALRDPLLGKAEPDVSGLRTDPQWRPERLQEERHPRLLGQGERLLPVNVRRLLRPGRVPCSETEFDSYDEDVDCKFSGTFVANTATGRLARNIHNVS